MILYKQDNVLFTGDNVTNKRMIRMVDASFAGSIAAIETAKTLNPAVVVPGHGKTGGIELLDNYHTYLSTLFNSVSEYFEEDLSDFEMKPKIHAKLVDYHDWSGYDDELGKHISIAYLEVEAEAF